MGRGSRARIGLAVGLGAAIVLLSLIPGACASSPADSLDVFAAASLTDAFDELAHEFETDSGIDVRLNFAGSAALREQLLDGAPADVFASANLAIGEQVASALDLAAPQPFASNRLVLAVPAANPAEVDDLGDLDRAELFVGRCAAGVPCGDLADELLTSAGVVGAFDTVDGDVRLVLRRLVDAELDAGLIYSSDVVASSGAVTEISAPGGHKDGVAVVQYPIVVVSDDDAAQRFVEFVASDRGREVLAAWGFGAP